MPKKKLTRDQYPTVVLAKEVVQFAKDVVSDLRRNAKAAIKNGSTRNLAPRVS